MTARSLLFVPGSRPERFPKAANSGADVVVLDLEDAVAPAEKPQARTNAERWLAGGGVGLVRINARETPWYQEDIDMVARSRCPVMIPKVESSDDIAAVQRYLPNDTPLIALLESAVAVAGAASICRMPGVLRAAFGSFDLGAELGIDPDDRQALLHARGALVLACAAAKIAPPVDGVTAAVDDIDALSRDLNHARSLGFGGKLCIHPCQVAHVNQCFMPTDDEAEWAHRVLNGARGQGVAVVDGKMVDAPVLARARRIATWTRG
ncbi:CoA ester lyase [Mycobacterium sp. pUA109]|uniref:CoA ester lyase n=1 Tax=Mycobacterium sp. pUA109 TaxID=3238982 RepID=UPI00351AE6F3